MIEQMTQRRREIEKVTLSPERLLRRVVVFGAVFPIVTTVWWVNTGSSTP